MKEKLIDIDTIISDWMYKYGILFLRISLAVVFIWFGGLKPLGLSPAAGLVEKTVYWMPAEIFIPILGWWEVLIGVCLLYRPLIKVALTLLFLQMPGTALPLVLLPEVCFVKAPYALTMEGQYIIKNLVLISAAIVIGGTSKSKNQSNRRKQVY
jgi:uncharacterized membrane protein YkgB